MIYEWKDAAHISVDAQIAGDFLDQLKVRHNGHLSPRAVVEAARDEASPIHAHFEWDDTVAAEHYRQQQAGYMLRCLVVRTPEVEHKPVRAFVSVSLSDERSYVGTQEAMADPDMRGQVLAQALREMVSFRRRYRELEELAEIFTAIDRLPFAD